MNAPVLSKSEKQGQFWPYPPVGEVAVMQSGERILVLHREGEDADGFTGALLGGTHELSAMWDITKISHIEVPARPVIREGRFIRFNAYWTVDGKWNREYLRLSAVRRLYGRKKIDATQAAKFLTGFVPKKLEQSVVATWGAQ